MTEVAVDARDAWIRDEQKTLWDDLENTIRSAINGSWSIAASNVARRIVAAARLVGPTPYDSVPYRLVAGGVYGAVLDAGHVPVHLPDEDEFQRLDQMMARHEITRDLAVPQCAPTIAAINEQREQAWINGDDE